MYNINFQLKKIWANNKPFVFFIGQLLVALSIIKIIFYYYNRHLLFFNSSNVINWQAFLKIIKWSIYADLLVLLPINFLFLALLQFTPVFKKKYYPKVLGWIFFCCNGIVLLLNTIDVFYFRFNNQRANADILYVLSSPITKVKHINPLLLLVVLLLTIGFLFFIKKVHKNLVAAIENGKTNVQVLVLGLLSTLLLFIFTSKTSKYFLPTHPLIQLNSSELSLCQNSAQTFLYSLFRKGEQLPQGNYFTTLKCDSLFTLKNKMVSVNKTKKNVVLFIMESVPFDFFDSSNKYYTQLPFFSSLLQKSTFYTNAFCYSLNSNKGITAILGSTPTVIDIPLYHSAYVNMPITKMGSVLKQQGYQSIFCIGDNYDDFGFAKCTNWLGFSNYYSKENIPKYKTLPSQAMGVHDEYVLDFMHEKITQLQQPFLSVNFNISTHYDYELPKNFSSAFPKTYSTAMKSMTYYDYSLEKFFNASKKEEWFKNTVFIFCSDHWMFPNEKNMEQNNVTNYKIPILIYDASNEVKKVDSSLVSQFDILPTILDISSYTGDLISYGNSLLKSDRKNITFSKINATLYQIVDGEYVLGFNAANNSVDYLYNYKVDVSLKNNLKNLPAYTLKKMKLEEKIKAILQKANMQYSNKTFN